MWDDFTASMLWTSVALVLLPNLLVILAKRKSRKMLLDSLESILAVALVIVLLVIVLGLPVGKQVAFTPPCPKRGSTMKLRQYSSVYQQQHLSSTLRLGHCRIRLVHEELL